MTEVRANRTINQSQMSESYASLLPTNRRILSRACACNVIGGLPVRKVRNLGSEGFAGMEPANTLERLQASAQVDIVSCANRVDPLV
jgi:hypothetical protein